MIPTEPIGSLPRPTALIDAVARGDSEDPRLDPLYESAIRDTIERFEATGSPVITDGEHRATRASSSSSLAVDRGLPADKERLHPTTSRATAGFIAGELTGLRILVVDDQADARDLISRVLQECGADVTTAATANEALAITEALRPDVLVSDIGMPDADGFELLRRVRALRPNRGGKVPAIALTAFARSEHRTRALRAGFLVHVSKPVDPSELVATVASVAGRVANGNEGGSPTRP
jgi:CheY-like chemotaxis protein